MDNLKKFFPLSKSMNDTFKRYLIGCGIYAAILLVANFVINLFTTAVAAACVVPVIGWIMAIIFLPVLSFISVLAKMYCLCGVVLLTGWFWQNNVERDSLKKFFPLAYKLNDSRSDFILSMVLYVAAMYVMNLLLPIVCSPFSAIPVIGSLLASALSIAVSFYYAATLILHILVYCDTNVKETVEETVGEETAV